MKLRSPYSYDTDKVSAETALKCEDESLAQQQFAEESDINFIAERYGLTGEMPQVLNLPRFGDFTGIFDFATAQQAVIDANRQFLTLPAKMRARFNNEPQKLLEFLEDPENRAEAELLGLVNKPKEAPESPTAAPGGPTKGEPASSPKAGSREPASPTKQDPKGSKTDT